MKASFHNTKIDEFNNVIPQLHYYPIADGIFDYDLTDSNDFLTMREGVCAGFDNAFGRPCNGPGAPQVPLSFSQSMDVTCPEF